MNGKNHDYFKNMWAVGLAIKRISTTKTIDRAGWYFLSKYVYNLNVEMNETANVFVGHM